MKKKTYLSLINTTLHFNGQDRQTITISNKILADQPLHVDTISPAVYAGNVLRKALKQAYKDAH